MRLALLASLVLVAAASCGGGANDPAAPDATVTVPPAIDAPATTTTPATCAGLDGTTGDSAWIIQSSGVPRTVNVHVPLNYDPTAPTPVVLNFHGFTSDNIQQDLLSQMDPVADAQNFIAIYPLGTGAPLSFNAGVCCGTASATNVDDIQFVRDILTTAKTKLCVDPKRIFATGMSNGGFMSHRIGCELADQIAAIAPVAGVLGVPTCSNARPMPVMHFHGTLDPLVPWDGDAALGFISVPDSIAGWVARDSCTGDPVQTYQNGDATCSTYQQCAGGAEVELCTIDGGGHTWPGGTPVPTLGYTSTDINATAEMWKFFQRHPLP
jgi:polyhydroxybutyrate depolymerase